MPEYSEEERRQIRSTFERENYSQFVAEKTSELAGAGIVFTRENKAHLTHVFVSPKHRGGEIADKLRQAMLRHAFEELGAKSAHASATEKNAVEKTRKVFEALGFAKDGKYGFSISRKEYFRLKKLREKPAR
ncbi:GNAT family N-acetyltransferase [Candidatus Micrarchaeota archaeon]|nr:GNAT family N-acetyltransferase [Candidatus Micrarchaeota archaeon]